MFSSTTLAAMSSGNIHPCSDTPTSHHRTISSNLICLLKTLA